MRLQGKITICSLNWFYTYALDCINQPVRLCLLGFNLLIYNLNKFSCDIEPLIFVISMDIDLIGITDDVCIWRVDDGACPYDIIL
ncbi:hypothetical protein ECA3272 [Pectobacterium atrosepticum SCRI1043]|uniref:Uncharacterized protein n=1 Tax=Pectobacterium atrosepticum (strain SCRI 1043 / ATCC BAA-672) TaxID=218491 RepID=Q6D224_PECAS|nr:hypothetical protein ECA3272 [Pectobacterium atrosepticum SCRI1043]